MPKHLITLEIDSPESSFAAVLVDAVLLLCEGLPGPVSIRAGYNIGPSSVVTGEDAHNAYTDPSVHTGYRVEGVIPWASLSDETRGAWDRVAIRLTSRLRR